MKTTTALAGAILLSLGSASALAGTHLGREPIGFSADGRYYAYTLSGIQDGSGFGICRLVVLSVERNRVVATFEETSDPDPAATPACELARAAAARTLAELGLDHALPGTPVELRPGQPRGSPAEPAGRTTRADLAVADPARACLATLNERNVAAGPPDLTPSRWRLEVTCERLGRVLEASGVALGAELVSAVAHREGLVVFLGESRSGSEGPDTAALAVGGRLARGGRIEVEPIGFDRRGARFGWWRSAVTEAGLSCAELHAADTDPAAGSLQLENCADAEPAKALAALKAGATRALADLGVGADPGEELFGGGPATRAALVVPGLGRMELRLESEPRLGARPARAAAVLTWPDGTERSVWSREGTRFTIDSVRLSRGSRSLAIMFRYTKLEGGAEVRELRAVVVPLGRTSGRSP